MDVNRMRRYAAKRYPDTVSRTFDGFADPEKVHPLIYDWVKRFRERMVKKYGDRFKDVHIWVDDFPLDARYFKYTLEVVLHD